MAILLILAILLLVVREGRKEDSFPSGSYINEYEGTHSSLFILDTQSN